MVRVSVPLFLLCGLSSIVWISANASGSCTQEVNSYLEQQNANFAPPTAANNVDEASAAAAASASSQEWEAIPASSPLLQYNAKPATKPASSSSAPAPSPSSSSRHLNDAKTSGESKKSEDTDRFSESAAGRGIWTYLTVGVVTLFAAIYVLREHVFVPRVPAGFKLPQLYSEGVPEIGTMIAFAKNPLALLQRGHKACSGAFTIRAGPQRITFLTGQEGLEAFFKADDLTLDLGKVYKLTVPVFGPGVIYDAPLDKRSQQYKMMAICLKTNKLISYVPLLEAEVTQYIERWGESGQIDVASVMSELIILTAARCLLGQDVRENVFEDVSRLFTQLDQGMLPYSVLFPYLPTKPHKIRDRAHKEMVTLFSGVIARRRAIAAEQAAAGNAPNVTAANAEDVLEALMYASYRDGTMLTDQEIAGMLIALLFAGQHTSSVTSAWTGLFLMRHPAMLERVLKEQEETGANKGNLNHELLNRLPVLSVCVRESLRMHPPLIFLMRAAIKDLTFGTTCVPKGDIIFASPAHAGRLDDIFTNPDKWDPDRFLAPREEDKASPVGNLSFGMGRHHCLGENFGLLQVKTIWSTLLRHYEFEAVGPLPLPDYSGMVVGPIHSGCTLKYKKRAVVA